MTGEEQYELLSGNGIPVKRPLLIGNDFVLGGFKKRMCRYDEIIYVEKVIKYNSLPYI